MQLKLDKDITYAIALEGGGARGGYEIGVWKALEETGIKYNAVSGTSVGALNGALFAMRDLQKAIDIWSDITITDVIDVPEERADELQRIVSGNFDLKDVKDFAPQARDIIKNKGLDVSPLRGWVRCVVDAEAVKASDVELYVTTVNLSDKKGMVVKVNDLEEDCVCDMLLASAYHPTFKLEKLGGKFYTDGGFIDSLPISPLVDAGYKNIIAVHIPGMGNEKRVKLTDDINIHHIIPEENLGSVLNFDSEQARADMTWGYFDAKRMLYGLAGKKYYIDRSLSQFEALQVLIEYYSKDKPDARLREICEFRIPAASVALGQISGDYYDLLIALCENRALQMGIERCCIYSDRDFIKMALGLSCPGAVQ